MELKEYLEVLLRWGWVIALVTVACTGAAIGVSKLQTPRYTSIVELNVTPARLDLALSQPVVNLFHSYVASIQSQSMASRVIQRLSLKNIDAAALRSRIKAEANESDYGINIEVTDQDPALAQRAAQAVAEVFAGDVQAFAARQDPLDRLTATILNGGAQPAGRTWPKTRQLTFAGLGGGFILGLLIALALEWAREDLVQTPQEVEQWVGLPVLASIPASRLSKAHRIGTPSRERPTDDD